MRKDVSAHGMDRHERTPLSHAAKHGHVGVVAILLQQPDVTYDPFDVFQVCPLFCAAGNGHTTIVNTLLEHGFKADLHSLMQFAGSSGHIETVNLLWRTSGRSKNEASMVPWAATGFS